MKVGVKSNIKRFTYIKRQTRAAEREKKIVYIIMTEHCAADIIIIVNNNDTEF